MSGWGRVSSLFVVGILLGAGCGGRTGALDDDAWGPDGDVDEGGSVSLGGKASVAGRAGRGGRGNGASAGSLSPGGYGTGGAVVYPVAGASVGGSSPIPVAGSGGYSFGGYGGSLGGYGGYSFGGYGGQPQEACGLCLVRSCSAPLTECLQDFGCIAILSCVQSKRCDAFECYSDAYCRDVIDQWGGPAGDSMSSILQTFSCALSSGCRCN